MTQYSLFGAAAGEPLPHDVEALLLAGAQWLRRPHGGTRLSVVVEQQWRADALLAEFAARSLTGSEGMVAAAAGTGVRTRFDIGLDPLAARWVSGARQRVPNGFTLGAGGLRLWAIAVGTRDDAGYLLRTADGQPELQRAAGSALAGIGVAAVALGNRGGPGWRITSTRRLRRFAELLGPPPAGAFEHWPQPPGRLG